MKNCKISRPFGDLCFFCAFESPPTSATLHPIHRRRTHTSNVSQRVMRMWFAIWRTPERQKETVLQFNMGRKTPDWQRHKELLRWSLRQSERPLDKPIIVRSPFFLPTKDLYSSYVLFILLTFSRDDQGVGKMLDICSRWVVQLTGGVFLSWQQENFSARQENISLPGKKKGNKQ